MIEEIARRVTELSFAQLSEAARERLLLCVLANLSVGIAGAAYTRVPEPPAGAPYRLLSGGGGRDRGQAAFWNAAAMHARTQDDFHPVGNLHIGTVVLPALLAIDDEAPLSGPAFLDALAAGYMVAVGLSRSASPVTTPRGLRSTCLYAPFGVTAAVARAQRASPERTAHALALTTAFNSGTTQTWIDGSDEWQVHAGAAAEAGLRANALAAAGVRGGTHALDGPAGFFNAVVGRNVGFADLEADFEPSAAIEETVIKRWPVSGICQSVVLAAIRAAERLGSDAATVRGLRIEMNAFEIGYPGTLNRGPFKSFGDRLMSAAFCAASVVVHKGFRFDDFHAGQHSERDRLVAAAEVTADPELPLLSSRVRLELADGRRIDGSVDNARDEIRIDWGTVDEWAVPLWREAGRREENYARCREAVLNLPENSAARLPIA